MALHPGAYVVAKLRLGTDDTGCEGVVLSPEGASGSKWVLCALCPHGYPDAHFKLLGMDFVLATSGQLRPKPASEMSGRLPPFRELYAKYLEVDSADGDVEFVSASDHE